MTSAPRAELEEMVERWLQANRDCEAIGDWRPMADMYTTDATYGWNYGPHTDFMAVGREEIRDLALGAEMGGLDDPKARLLVNSRSGRAAVQVPATSLMLDDGTIEPRLRLIRPTETHTFPVKMMEDTHWLEADRAAFGAFS